MYKIKLNCKTYYYFKFKKCPIFSLGIALKIKDKI